MQKKIFAVFAVISGIIAGLLGGSNTYATSGNTATISDGDWNICASATSYAGSSFIATVSGAGFDTQLVFDDFETEACKDITLATGGDNTVTMNSPMGVSGMSYEVDTTNNKVTFAYGSLVNKYINNYGSFSSIIGASKVRIKYDANGGTGSIADQDDIDLNTNVTLTSNTFTYTGYSFDGWNTKADGTGTSYTDGETTSFTTGGEVTLYAQWHEIRNAYLQTGPEVNAAIKTLANGAAKTYSDEDSTVKSLTFVDELPVSVDPDTTPKTNIALSSSDPVYVYKATADDYYIYSEADNIYANSDSSFMFNNMSALTSLTLPETFNTSNVTDMSHMFGYARNLTSLALPESFDTSNVTDMDWMFGVMASLTSLTLPETFNTSSVTDMSHMFFGVDALTSLTLPETFDTSNVTDMSFMFSDVHALTSLTLPESFNTSNVTNMSGMFSAMTSLTSLTLPDGFVIGSSTRTSMIFANISTTATLCALDATARSLWPGELCVLAYLDTGQNVNAAIKTLANGTSKTYSFSDTAVKSLTFVDELPDTIDPDTAPKTNIALSGSEPVYVYQATANDYYIYTAAEKMYADSDSKNMFAGMTALTSLTLPESFDTSSVTDMSNMFENMSSLTSLTFPETFNTSKVTDMQSMFGHMSALTSLTLPESFDTSSVTDMSFMFSDMSSLTSLTLPETFDTSNVTDMFFMFYNVSSLTSLTLPETFDTSSATDMTLMFSGMSSLTSLTLPETFNTSNVTEMFSMFADMSSLTSLTLPNVFVIGQSTTTTDIFKSISSSATLYAANAKVRSLWPGVLGN